jgi:transcriptional regulator with XRE-family HTH domain
MLRALRDSRKLSTAQVEGKLADAGTRLGRSTVTQYEKGTVWSPDPIVLSELARIYRVDIRGLIAVLKANRQNPALSGEEADAIHKGASDAGAAEVGVLRDERDAAVATLREMRELAEALVRIAYARAADSEGAPATTRKARRGAAD